MSQKRYIDFGNSANASNVKAINQQLFAPQVLRADEPFFSVQPPNEVLIQPHAVVFESGVVLVEDEAIVVEIASTFPPADYTIYYEHTDEAQIGGSPALLKTVNGLLQSVVGGVILGWVVYPGGSVPLSAEMLFTNSQGRIAGPHTPEQVREDGGVTLFMSGTVTDAASPVPATSVIPGSPYQIVAAGAVVSDLLGAAEQKIRVYNVTDGGDFERVASSPGLGEFSVNTTTGTFTFDTGDSGKTVTIFDMTYGKARKVANSSPTDDGIIHRMFTFGVTPVPIRTIFVEYVALTGSYTVDEVEAFDVNLEPAVLKVKKVEALPIDGSIARLAIRLVGGIFFGSGGEQFSVRLRETLGPSSSGLLLRVRASSRDLPF